MKSQQLNMPKELLKAIGHSTGNVSIEFMLVTPAQAHTWLEKNNKNNRPMSDKQVSKLIDEMNNGRWVFNGATVVFGSDGNVQNGQHRLKAIVRSGVEQVLIVVRGIKPSAADSHDSLGKARHGGDVLSRHGVTFYNQVAATLRMLASYDEGRPMNVQGIPRGNPEVVSLWKKYSPYVEESVAFTKNMRHVAPSGVVATAHYLFSRVDRDLANEFMRQIETNVGFTSPEDPGAALLRKLALAKNKTEGAHVRNYFLLSHFIRAWNAFIQAESISVRAFRNPTSNKDYPRVLDFDGQVVSTNLTPEPLNEEKPLDTKVPAGK